MFVESGACAYKPPVNLSCNSVATFPSRTIYSINSNHVTMIENVGSIENTILILSFIQFARKYYLPTTKKREREEKILTKEINIQKNCINDCTVKSLRLEKQIICNSLKL